VALEGTRPGRLQAQALLGLLWLPGTGAVWGAGDAGVPLPGPAPSWQLAKCGQLLGLAGPRLPLL